MQTSLTQDLKTDQKIVEECVMAHLLEVALDNVGKDEAETGIHVQKTWVQLLDQETAIPLQGLYPFRKVKIATEVARVTDMVIKNIQGVSLWREMALTIALLTLDLTLDSKIKNAHNQATMIASLIVDENQRCGEDWGSEMKCKSAAHFMKKELNAMGYFL